MYSGDSMTTAPSMADLGTQRHPDPANAAQGRARYFNSANAFNVKLPPVCPVVFLDPMQNAMSTGSPTGFFACDQSDALDCPHPATTPLMLARYARINAGESLTASFKASGSMWHVISGAGKVAQGDTQIEWAAGDTFYLPGAMTTVLQAGSRSAVLWVVTDEPLCAHTGMCPSTSAQQAAVHFPAEVVADQIARIHQTEPDADTSGMAVVFSCEELESHRNLMPTLTLSFNTLSPRSSQRPHRHNSAALTLVLSGDDCHSTIDGTDHAWTRWTTLVTPPGAAHSHHNAGDARADFLIAQDGALYYYARTMGFSFLE